MTAAELFAVTDAHFKAEYEGDLDATMATIHLNPHFILHPLGMEINSWDGVREYYKGLYDAGFHHFDATILGRWAVDARTVIVETTVRMDVSGEFLGMKIDGTKTIVLPQIDILTIDDGLISGERVYFDMSTIQKQLSG